MLIRFGNTSDPVAEGMQAGRAKARAEDGRTAPVSGSERGLDAGDKAEAGKKAEFALAGDRVQISREARELLRTQGAENPEADERREEKNEYASFAEAANNLKGLSENFQSPATSGLSGGGGDDNGGGTVEKLRKLIEEAQKKLEEAQQKLAEAMARAGDDQAAQAEMQAAQQEVAVANAELQMLQSQLQEVLQSGGGGGAGATPVSGGGGWSPDGSRIQVGAGGITSLV